MYDEERINWWVSRSKLSGHQKAYDILTKSFNVGNGSIIIDFGCGNGEVLNRIHKRKKKVSALLIGTDTSKRILEIARDGLYHEGIASQILEDPFEIQSCNGIVLLEDNLTDSKIPAGISDVSILSFPELQLRVDTAIAKEIQEHNTLISQMDFLHSMQYAWLSRATREGGNVIIIDYDVQTKGIPNDHDVGHYDGQRELARRFGLRLSRRTFVSSEEVFQDLEGKAFEKNPRWANMKRGYSILTFSKN